MKAVGLVTEYNPFHYGHLYNLNKAMELTGADISVAVMSGDFVQRGEPAVLDKYSRASMALISGVNLVVELPVNYAVSCAENFAAGALKVLDYIKADSIAFGSESGDIERLSKLAHVLCDNEDTLYKEISKNTANGITYAAARQKVVEKLMCRIRYIESKLPVFYFELKIVILYQKTIIVMVFIAIILLNINYGTRLKYDIKNSAMYSFCEEHKMDSTDELKNCKEQ